MNLSMKMNTMIAAAALALGLGMTASTASAACMDETTCFDTGFGIELGGTATFQGFGAGMFTGEEGGVLIEKEGGSWTSTKLNVAGDACGFDCGDAAYTFDAGAFETVNVKAGALGSTSGEMVSVINEGGAASFTSFDFGKFSFSPDE